jgi:hypothetical protein
MTSSKGGDFSIRASLLGIFETGCGGISGKTSGNRGPVAQFPLGLAVSVGLTLATATATERLTLDATRHHGASGLPRSFS